MSRVFVVQKQHRWNDESKQFEPRFNLGPAEKFGQLEFLLSPSAAPWRPESIVRDLQQRLADITSEDFLLLIGNPVLIGLATAVAVAQVKGDQLQMLQWSGKDQRYIPIVVNVASL